MADAETLADPVCDHRSAAPHHVRSTLPARRGSGYSRRNTHLRDTSRLTAGEAARVSVCVCFRSSRLKTNLQTFNLPVLNSKIKQSRSVMMCDGMQTFSYFHLFP